MVDEPTVEQTITMLRGLKSRYELHHSITIRWVESFSAEMRRLPEDPDSDAAVVSAAVLSARYITDRHLPVRSSFKEPQDAMYAQVLRGVGQSHRPY